MGLGKDYQPKGLGFPCYMRWAHSTLGLYDFRFSMLRYHDYFCGAKRSVEHG